MCCKHVQTVYSTEIYGYVRGLGQYCSLVVLNGRIASIKYETYLGIIFVVSPDGKDKKSVSYCF